LAPESQIAFVAIATIVGLVTGSFLNVCIYRIPRDVSIVFPRSFCVECGKQISWYDNVPLLSYALLHGRCRFCRKPIELRYPIVELMTAVVFIAIAIRYGWSVAALKWAVFEATLIVLFWTDLEERILPDELTLGGFAAGLIFAAFVPVYGAFGDLFFPGMGSIGRSFLNAGVAVIFLAGLIWLMAILYARVRRREGLGFGDVKLLALLAVFLGLEKGIAAVLIGAVAGSVIGGGYILLAHKKASTYELPFGSFLCAGAAIVPLLSS